MYNTTLTTPLHTIMLRCIQTFIICVCVAIFLSKPLAQAQEYEYISIRGWDYENFTRYVFEWNNTFDYGVHYDGTKVSVLFSRPFQGSIQRTLGKTKARVRNGRISNDNKVVTFFTNKPIKVVAFPIDNALVVDLIDVQTDETVDIPQQLGNLSLASWRAERGEIGDKATVEVEIDDPDAIFRKGIDLQSQPETAQLPDTIVIQEEEKPDDRYAASAIDPATLPPSLGSFIVPFSQPTGAAAFRKGNDLWLIFDEYVYVDITDAIANTRSTVDIIEQLPVTESTILRIRTKPGYNPILQRGNNGTDWVIDLYRYKFTPLKQINIEFDTSNPRLGSQMVFPTLNPGRVVIFKENQTGDVIRVITYLGEGEGVYGLRIYPEFLIFPSTQGVAMQFLKESISLRALPDAFIVSDRTGLYVSAVPPDAEATVDAEKERLTKYSQRLIFDFPKWRGPVEKTFYDKYVKIIQDISLAPPDDKSVGYFELSKFLIAHSLGQEAISLLDEIEKIDVNLSSTPEFLALKGLANYLSQRSELAKTQLFDSSLDSIQEVMLWRAALHVDEGMWVQAELLFRQADRIYREYPKPLLGLIGLKRLQSSLAIRDIEVASAHTDFLKKENQLLTKTQFNDLLYQEARVFYAQGEIDEAENSWKNLSLDYTDFRNSARSEYALLSLLYRQERISSEEILARLENLRYRWRGDRFELNVLNQLAEIYFDLEKYPESLRAMRSAVTTFPNDPLSTTLLKRMKDTFASIYLEEKSKAMPPLKALALFDEFRELTPVNYQGNLIIEKLVDLLLDIDLLTEAATLLSHQIDFRLDGLDKARVGLKLALIHIIDEAPDETIKALDASTYPNPPSELANDRRLVRAKALYDLGKIEESTYLIAGDLSFEADLLRQDISWQQQNWVEVARVMQRLAGEPPKPGQPLSDEVARIVLYWAVALILDNNIVDLNGLIQNFGASMQNSSYQDTYNFVISAHTAESADNIRTLIKSLVDRDKFDSFVQNYRDKLRDLS